MSLFYFGAGYRFYTPRQAVVQTLYQKHGRPTLTSVQIARLTSEKRVMDLARSHPAIKAFATYSGIDITRQLFTADAEHGITFYDTPEERQVKHDMFNSIAGQSVQTRHAPKFFFKNKK